MRRRLARHALSDDRLDYVARDYVLAGLLDHLLVVLASHVELKVGVGLTFEVRFRDLWLLFEPHDYVVDPVYGVLVGALGVSSQVGVAHNLDLVA